MEAIMRPSYIQRLLNTDFFQTDMRYRNRPRVRRAIIRHQRRRTRTERRRECRELLKEFRFFKG